MQLSATLLPPLASPTPNKAHFSLTFPRHPQEGQSWVGCSDPLTNRSISNISPRALSVHHQVWGHVSLGRPLPWPSLRGLHTPSLVISQRPDHCLLMCSLIHHHLQYQLHHSKSPACVSLQKQRSRLCSGAFHTPAGESLKPETEQTFSLAQLFCQGMDRLTDTCHHRDTRLRHQ